MTGSLHPEVPAVCSHGGHIPGTGLPSCPQGLRDCHHPSAHRACPLRGIPRNLTETVEEVGGWAQTHGSRWSHHPLPPTSCRPPKEETLRDGVDGEPSPRPPRHTTEPKCFPWCHVPKRKNLWAKDARGGSGNNRTHHPPKNPSRGRCSPNPHSPQDQSPQGTWQTSAKPLLRVAISSTLGSLCPEPHKSRSGGSIPAGRCTLMSGGG